MMKKIRAEKGGGGDQHCNSQSAALPSLPDEILYEILTRVTLDDLLQSCRWVCRGWQALTYDSTFRSLHRNKTRPISGYLVQFVNKDKSSHIDNDRSHVGFISSSSNYTDNIMPEKSTWIRAATCQAPGLVCWVTSLDFITSRYYVCNPLTRQQKEIPNPKNDCYNERMAIMVMRSNPLHYKIIRFSTYIGEWCMKYCEIFDSKNWKWRIHSKSKRLPYFDSQPELLLYDSFHWLTTDEKIFVFDFFRQDWRFIMLPQLEDGEAETIKYDRKLVDCEGNLGVLYSPRLARGCLWIELWVMEDYLKETWKKKYRLSLEPLDRLEQPCSILAINNMMNSILVKVSDKIVWYNFITGARTRVKKLRSLTTTLVRYIHPFNSDFVPYRSLDEEDDDPEKEAN